MTLLDQLCLPPTFTKAYIYFYLFLRFLDQFYLCYFATCLHPTVYLFHCLLDTFLPLPPIRSLCPGYPFTPPFPHSFFLKNFFLSCYDHKSFELITQTLISKLTSFLRENRIEIKTYERQSEFTLRSL